MSIISLKPCPKVYILETHRSKTPESTLAFVKRIRETVEMKSFRDATEVDRIGIPVFTCDRVRPDGSTTSHTGKGVTPIQAQVSIMMESIERYCSEFRDEYRDKLVRGSYSRLKDSFEVLDPREMILSPDSDYRDDKEIYWMSGCDLLREKEVLVPACAVYHPFHLDGLIVISTHTNGIAAGNTYEEAVIHGLAELIERDAWSLALYARTFNDSLFIEDDPENGFIIEAAGKFDSAGIEIVAKDLTSDTGVPVIGAFSRDLIHRNMAPISGFGAHLDPRVSMVRAVLEIATTRALFIQKYGIEGMCLAASYLQGDGEEEDPRFYAFRQKGLKELETGYESDILLDIRAMMSRLERRGLDRIIAVDLTRPDIGVPTVRMIVPGLEVYCFDNARTGRRARNFLADQE
ncbi:MAG TPA: YcaO-like family protein [Syntrophales bacterium]|nr:YcaO-like family protein [Syntrophales bacterium]